MKAARKRKKRGGKGVNLYPLDMFIKLVKTHMGLEEKCSTIIFSLSLKTAHVMIMAGGVFMNGGIVKKSLLLGKKLLHKLLLSLRRFPEALLFCVLTVMTLIILNHMGTEYDEGLRRIAMVFALGIPVSLSIKMLFETITSLKHLTRLLIYLGAALGLVLYYTFWLENMKMVSTLRYLLVTFALYLLFTFIPYIYKKKGYELYVITLASRFFVTYLYSAVLFVGLAAIIFTINELFSANLPERLYLDIWLLAAGVFAPAFFLADIPKAGEELQVTNYSKVLKLLLLYIVMPIVATYTLILYAFFIKILVTVQWPKGIVSHLVLWYSIVTTITIFLIYPLRSENKWVDVFSLLMPKILLPLLTMMFVSMGIRIQAYGITENRYLVLAAGLWVTAVMIYFIFVRNPRNVMLAVSAALIAVISVTGPLSCFSVSKYSQNSRFEYLLEKNDMLKDGEINPASGKVSADDKEQISSILLYFDRNHKLSDLKYLPENFELTQMKDVFGFDLSYSAKGAEIYFAYNLKNEDALLPIKNYDYFLSNVDNSPLSVQIPGGYVLSYNPEQMNMKISKENETVYDRVISDLVVEIPKQAGNEHSLPLEKMTVYDEVGDLKLIYVFQHITGKEAADKEIIVEWVSFNVFISL